MILPIDPLNVDPLNVDPLNATRCGPMKPVEPSTSAAFGSILAWLVPGILLPNPVHIWLKIHSGSSAVS
jgi:hypothetical protein